MTVQNTDKYPHLQLIQSIRNVIDSSLLAETVEEMTRNVIGEEEPLYNGYQTEDLRWPKLPNVRFEVEVEPSQAGRFGFFLTVVWFHTDDEGQEHDDANFQIGTGYTRRHNITSGLDLMKADAHGFLDEASRYICSDKDIFAARIQDEEFLERVDRFEAEFRSATDDEHSHFYMCETFVFDNDRETSFRSFDEGSKFRRTPITVPSIRLEAKATPITRMINIQITSMMVNWEATFMDMSLSTIREVILNWFEFDSMK